MTGYRPLPRRHWRSYGNDPLPTGKEALNEPFSAFPKVELLTGIEGASSRSVRRITVRDG